MNAIIHATLLLPEGPVEGQALLFDERIRGIVPEANVHDGRLNVDACIDAHGLFISPGFIDVHVHGAGGADAMDATPEALGVIAGHLAATGTTAFLPTTMSETPERIARAVENIQACMLAGSTDGAEILGCHLEGPWLSAACCGAQDPARFGPPDPAFVARFRDVLRLITLAPERDETGDFLRMCRDAGIALSIGHSAATYEQAVAAFHCGVVHATHLFNGMLPLHHRNPGIVGAVLTEDVRCELIVDGHHLHPAIPKLVLNAKGLDRIVLVTDAMRAQGMSDGEYELGGQTTIVKGGTARLPGGGLAGSVLTMNLAVRNFMEATGLPLHRAVLAATRNPAELLGIRNRKGGLEPGLDADMVFLDEHLTVRRTIVRGRTVYLP